MAFVDKALAVLGDIGANRTNLDMLENCIQQIVPFVGAGLSYDFSYPTWNKFLEDAAIRFDCVAQVSSYLKAGQLEEAAEAVAVDYNAFDDFLNGTFTEKRLKRPLNSGAVLILPRIASGPVLTTNFDRVLEAAFESSGKRFREVFPGSRIRMASRAIQWHQPFLLKLHGDYSDSKSRVLTLKEYAKEYGNDPEHVDFNLPLPRVLSQALVARPLLFLGCSLQGDRTMLLIAEIAQQHPGIVHFALLSAEENTTTRLHQLDQWSIRPLFFPAGKFEKIKQFLECVAEAVSPSATSSAPNITVPPLHGNLVMRSDELQGLCQTVMADSGGFGVALTALEGMGGIGKTVLAQFLCSDKYVQDSFPNGVLWVTAGQEPVYSLRDRVNALRSALGDKPSVDESEIECIHRYRTIVRDKAVLIVVDDVWRVDDLQPFLAESSRSRVLFTTRNASIAASVGAQTYCVGLLTPDKSREILARYAGVAPADLPNEAELLIKECGRLPLALAMVGAKLNRKPLTEWKRVLNLLRSADLSKIGAGLPNYYTQRDSLLKCIQVSIDELEAVARQHYLALAVLLEDMVVEPAVQQTLWNANPDEAMEIAETFIGLSLAQRDGAGFRLHDLQLDYVRARYPDHNALDIIRQAVRLSAAVLDRDSGQFASQLVGRLLPRRDVQEVDHFIHSIVRGAPTPWLRPTLPALDPPGTPLCPPREGHYAGVNGVAITTDGRRVISASLDETLKVWDVESGRELYTLKGHSSAVYGVAVSADGRRAVSASGDSTLKVWDLENGREIRTLRGHSRTVINVAVSPDGRQAISASWDKTLKMWDLETGDELKTFRGHSKCLNSVAVNSDWTLAVSASEDKTLKVWDLKTGRELRTLTGHSADVWGVALSADGRWAVSASEDKTLKVWNLKTGRELRTLRGHTSAVYGVAVSTDGRLAVSASDDAALKVWNVRTGRLLRTLEGHITTVYGVAVSEDGRLAVSASYDATLKIWDLETGREVRTLKGGSEALNAVSVNAEGGLAVFASDDGTLKLWDLRVACELRTLSGHTSFVYGVAMSGDGRRAASASDDGTIRVWDLESGDELRSLRGHPSGVNDVAVSADWKVAISASYDKTLKVWDLENGRKFRTLRGHRSSVLGVAISADGRRAVSASYDATLRVWDVESGRSLHTLKSHLDSVNCVAMTADGRVAVSGSDDWTVKVWDVENGLELRTLNGHMDSVSYVALSSDETSLVSASWDKTMRVWDLETGSLIATFTCDAPALCCGWGQNRKLIGGDHLGRIHLLSLELNRIR